MTTATETRRDWPSVEVTLADVVVHNGVLEDAIGAVLRRDLDLDTLRFSIHVATGICTGWDDCEKSPHSIIRLVCPPYTSAVESPEEFCAMAAAAHDTHDALSDASEWLAMTARLTELRKSLWQFAE